MAKKVLRSDVVEDGIFDNLKKSATDALSQIEKLQTGLKSTAKVLNDQLKGAQFGNAESINKFVQATEKANKVKKDSQKLDEESIKLQQQLTKLEQEEEKLKQQKMRTETQANREKERQAKASERAAKAAKDENSEYKKLVKSTRDLKNQSKELAAQMLKLEQSGQKNTKAYRNLESQYKKVTRAAQQGDKALKKIDSTVGDNFRNVGNYRSALGGLKNALSQLGLAFGVFQTIRSSFNIVKNFEQSQADLQAISGKTAEELSGLTAQAKQLGETTQFSATQITEMQIELAKLGFTNEQISDSTEAVSNFSAATGAAIPQAAALAGSALRSFGLDASEMDRVVSTLGVATTKSALSFESLNTGLSTIAPVAASFGFSIEDTTALLGQLANSGFDASSAATATRNILLNLADANGNLAKELGRPIKSADDLAGALSELDAKGIDLGKALELTDKRSVAAFNTFLKGSKDLIPLRDSITGVNDELTDMAEKRLDSVQGQLTLLSSAWEGFILGTNDATGASDKLKAAIGFLAKNLGTILSAIGKLITAFIAFKASMKALQLYDSIKNFRKFGSAVSDTAGNMTKAQASAKAFGKALKGIGFSLAITALIELTKALYDYASGAARARREAELFNKAISKGAEKAQAEVDAVQSGIESQIQNLRILRSDRKISAKEFEKRQREIYAKAEQAVSKQIKNRERAKKATEELLKEETKRFELAKKELAEKGPIGGLELSMAQGVYEQVKNRLAEIKAAAKGYNAELEVLRGAQKDWNNAVIESDISLNTLNNTTNNTASTVKETSDEIGTLGERIQDVKDVIREPSDFSIPDFVEDMSEYTEMLQERELELLKSGATQEEIQEEMLKKEIEILKMRIEAYEFLGEDTLALEIELQKKLNQLKKEGNEENFKLDKQYVDLVTEYFIKRSNERIDQIEKEIEAAQNQYDTLKQLAEDGNIDAKESLAEQQRIIAEANRAKEAEQRRQERIKLAQAAYEAYERNANDETVTNPLAKTITDITLLRQFIQSIPAFLDGTEDTGANGLGVDGKGGFHAILHPNERVMTKDQNAMVGSLTNEQLAKVALDYNTGKMIAKGDAAVAMHNPWESALLIQKIDELNATIRNKPETNIELERIVDGAMTITRSTKKGNTLIYNRHKVK